MCTMDNLISSISLFERKNKRRKDEKRKRENHGTKKDL